MKNIVPEQKRVYLPVVNSEQVFPVGRVYCVGRNYAEHAREMGDDPDRDPPFFFAKDALCVVPSNFSETTNIAYPMASSQFEYEVELVVALGQGGRNMTLEQAADAIMGYAVGLDMTRRDLQAQAKKKGRPWEVGKSFDQSAPISPIFPKTESLMNQLGDAQIGLMVNGEPKQVSRTSNLTWSIEEVICKLSEVFELRAGDLIMTGTPENVGAVLVGDSMRAWVEHLGEIQVTVTD